MKKIFMKKAVINIIFVIYIWGCLLFTVRNAQKEEDTYLAERYGLEKDQTIDLTEDNEVCVEFVLQHDNFQGIHLKFSSDYGFQEETIRASLFDAGTDDLMAEDVVELKYELIRNKDSGSTIYFELPVLEAANQEVYLKLSLEGNSVYVYPQLMLSASKVQNSVTYVNDEIVSSDAENLIFTARYKSGTVQNVKGTVFNGSIWVVLGIVVYLWIRIQTSGKNGDDVEIERSAFFGKWITGIGKFIIGHGKVIGFITMLLSIGFILIFVYQFYVEDAIDRHQYYAVVKAEKATKQIVLDSDASHFEQSITLDYKKDALKNSRADGLRIPLEVKNIDKNAEIQIVVVDETTGIKVVDLEQKLSDIILEENTYWVVSFQESIEISETHNLRLVLEGINLGTSSLKFVKGEEAEENTEIITVAVELNDNSFLRPMYTILCIGLMAVAVVLYTFCFLHPLRVEKLFLVTALSLGLAFCFVITLYGVPDEPTHIDTAYQVSNELLGIEDSSKPGYIYKRVDDADMMAEANRNISIESYKRLYENLFSKVQDETLVECAAVSALGNAGRLFYLPQALGISLGRILEWGHMPTMLLGRVFTLICYVILAYFAIKKLPFAKGSLFLIAILPISLQEAASYSYDSLINGIAFVFLSYSIYFVYSKYKDIKVGDVIILLTTGCLMVNVKGSVYLPLCCLPLLRIFRYKRKKSKKQFWFAGVICAIFLLFFLKDNLISTFSTLTIASGASIGGSTATQIYTLSDFIHSPLRLMGIFVNTVYIFGDTYLKNLLGGNLSWLNVPIAWYVSIGFLLLLLFSCVRSGQEKIISGGEKIYMGILAAGSLFLVMLSMLLVWTPVTYQTISGVQGRYFIPFFLLVLLIFRNSFFRMKTDISNILIFCAGILNITTLLQVVQNVL